MKHAEQGFTLIELLFVIAILGILAAIAVPKFSGVAASANTAKIQADLRTLDAAVMLYYVDRKTALQSEVGTQLDAYIERVPNPPEGAGKLADGAVIAVTKGAKYTIGGTEAGAQYAQVHTDKGEKKLADFVK